ncbi:MAG: single-stranded-DNA-specific exonuclease RecJ [Pseudomonadota bacterium]
MRDYSEDSFLACKSRGLSEVSARVLAARTAEVPWEVEDVVAPSLKLIPNPKLLADIETSASRLAEAIQKGQHIGLLTDYDVDGITSHTIAIEVIESLFKHPRERIHSFIGHRITEGYGISDKLTARILEADPRPQVIITADCGSSDEKNIAHLKGAGIDVIVSDHHGIPAAGLPSSAMAVVNPNRSDCHYPDKSIAGCMVTWLLLSHLRNHLIQQGLISTDTKKLSLWLDLVALGTVADAVSLAGPVNRVIVQTGLKQLNLKRRVCWQVLSQSLGKTQFEVDDLGFQIGPRINARGRIADPSAALHFLCATEPKDAQAKLSVLEKDNEDRKTIEKGMVAKGQTLIDLDKQFSQVVFDPEFHPGVQGIVASRLLDAWGKPAVVFSPGRQSDTITGSARSIPDVHILDVLKTLSQDDPDLFVAFGGHAGAAGMTLLRNKLQAFAQAFDREIASRLDHPPQAQVWTDGELPATHMTMALVNELQQLQPYGRGFEPPVFAGLFLVQGVRPVGAEGNHLQLSLERDGYGFRGIWFNAGEFVSEGDTLACAYRLDVNRFNGSEHLQLIVQYAEIAS